MKISTERKRSFQLVIALVCVLGFAGCDKINESIEISLPSVTIELEDVLVEDGSQKSVLNPFNVTQTLSYSSIVGLSEEAEKYKSNIETVKADSAAIIITATDSLGTVVEEFVLKVSGLSDFSVPRYNLDTPYATDDLKTYLTQLIMKLLLNDSIDLNLSGKTDVSSGENLKIKILLEDVTLIAKILKTN